MAQKPAETNPNSRRVWIFRASNFLIEAQGGAAADFITHSNQSIGSYWEKSQIKAPGSGLTYEEKRILMPVVLSLSAEDRDFMPKVAEYFHEMLTRIPLEGLELEIGLTKDNSAPITNDNFPIDVYDFIKWRHARGYPMCAPSPEDAKGNSTMTFYIYDPKDAKDKVIKLSDDRDEAMTIYLGLKKDSEKVDQLLTLLGTDPREFEKVAERTIALREKVEKAPGDFLQKYNIDNFPMRYTIQTLINVGIFQQVNGQQIIEKEKGTLIANSFSEAIHRLAMPDMENSLVIWKGLMQEALKKTLKKKKSVQPIA